MADGDFGGARCDAGWVLRGRDGACAEAGGRDGSRRVPVPSPLLFLLLHLLLLRLFLLLLRGSAYAALDVVGPSSGLHLRDLHTQTWVSLSSSVRWTSLPAFPTLSSPSLRLNVLLWVNAVALVLGGAETGWRRIASWGGSWSVSLYDYASYCYCYCYGYGYCAQQWSLE